MGVISCSKRGCQHIMCDTQIYGIGNICNQCKKDYKNYIQSNNVILENDEDINKSLSEFLELDVNWNKTKFNEDIIDNYFNSYTN